MSEHGWIIPNKRHRQSMCLWTRQSQCHCGCRGVSRPATWYRLITEKHMHWYSTGFYIFSIGVDLWSRWMYAMVSMVGETNAPEAQPRGLLVTRTRVTYLPIRKHLACYYINGWNRNITTTQVPFYLPNMLVQMCIFNRITSMCLCCEC